MAEKVQRVEALHKQFPRVMLRLRGAFTRRSLAYALAGIASFEVLEGWAQLLFDRVFQDPPSGHKHIIDVSKALDVAIKEVSHHPEVQFHMLPSPTYGAVAGASSAGDPRATPYHPIPDYGRKGKTKDKGKGKEKGAGKPICMKFNVGACRANIKAGKRCVHGYHLLER